MLGDEFKALQGEHEVLEQRFEKVQAERDELYKRFVSAIHEVQQKSNCKNLLLEKKLVALADTVEKKDAQLNEVLSASNLDPTALTVVTRKLEVKSCMQLRYRIPVVHQVIVMCLPGNWYNMLFIRDAVD